MVLYAHISSAQYVIYLSENFLKNLRGEKWDRFQYSGPWKFIITYRIHMSSIFMFCLFVCLLYVPSQQLWSLRDGQFT